VLFQIKRKKKLEVQFNLNF